MDFSACEDDLLYTDGCTAIVEVKEFSNMDIHTPHLANGCEPRSVDDAWSNDYIDYVICSNYFKRSHGILLGGREDCIIFIHPNVCDSSYEGYVGLECYLRLRWKDMTAVENVELTCMVAVIDAEGQQRFPQSFTFCVDPQDSKYASVLLTNGSPFFMNYVSRRVIQSDTEQLLLSPDDSLTLRVDVVLKEYLSVLGDASVYFEELLSSCFKFEEKEKDDAGDDSSNGITHLLYLRLDSAVARRLREESAFFDRMSTTPMAECVSGYVKIPDEMHDSFRAMLKILFKRSLDTPLIFTFDEVLSVYSAADFYCAFNVMESCRRWLRLMCSTPDHAALISKYADLYDDDELKEISEDFSTDEVRTYTDSVWTVSIVSEHFVFELRSKGNDGVDKTDVSNSYF